MKSQARVKRIGIDARLAGTRHAGIGRYLANLLRELPEFKTELEWVYFLGDQEQIEEIFPQGIPARVSCQLKPVAHYSWAEQLSWPLYLQSFKLDLLHVPHFNVPIFYPGRLIITIHDLLWHQQRGSQVTTLPEFLYWPKYLAYRLVVSRAVKKAELIVVPSQTIKNTLSRYYPAVASKIVVTLEGSSLKPPLSRRQPTLHDHQLLYIGSLYPHKNLKLVLTALKTAPNYQLVIVTARDAFLEKTRHLVNELGLKRRVRFLTHQSDQQLAALLAESLALVQPSLSEGFGLTGLEAMSAGTPVIASDIAVFREIYQHGASYFDPNSAADFLRAVAELQTGPRRQLIERGQQVAKNYSWQKMAQTTLTAYQHLLNDQPSN